MGKVQSQNHSIHIDTLSYRRIDNRLIILGSSVFDGTYISINGRIEKIKTIESNGTYKFRYELSLAKQRVDISFSRSDETELPLLLRFENHTSKLFNKLSYWRFAQYQATHNGTTITIRQKRSLDLFIREIAFICAMVLFWKHPRAAVMRILYWLTKPVFGRWNIWLFADKIYKAGDNAEYLYNYATKQKDSARKFYILSPKSRDTKRFRAEGKNFVRYKSLFQRLLFLHAKILVFTHNNAPGFFRFGGTNERYFRGLFNYDVMYIQHGLAVQQAPHLYDKSIDDIKQFFVASKFEKDNLLQPINRYTENEIVAVGMARYDGLINKDRRNILIAPTWRTYLSVNPSDYDEIIGKNSSFKQSEYFKIFNSLVQNKKLANEAKANGYTITFLLHPAMASHADDFERNDDTIDILTVNDGLNYEKILTESCLMVTDYSGLQFDFAYMYKPIIYLHSDTIPPSYPESAYRYKKHGLGEITMSVDELVRVICEYMQKDCELKPKFKKRIDEFFYYHDRSNCERIYDAIIQWQHTNS